MVLSNAVSRNFRDREEFLRSDRASPEAGERKLPGPYRGSENLMKRTDTDADRADRIQVQGTGAGGAFATWNEGFA